jgi:membrane protein required for colicin V production
VRFIIKAIEKLLKIAMLGTVNKIVGGLLYTLVSLFFISSLFWLGNRAGVMADGIKNESKCYTFVEPVAPKIVEVVSAYLPFCKDLYAKLQSNFTK